MVSSCRRKCLRLQLGVTRKLTATRWMEDWTVRVHVTRVRYGDLQLKAGKGAEKSCFKRRSRGQRKGKKRSRGRHPRLNAPIPAQKVDGPKDRTINMHLRACDYWYDVQEKFGSLFCKSKLFRELEGGPHYWRDSWGVPMDAWQHRWMKLRTKIVPCGEGAVWCSRIGPSFLYWLEQRFGITFKSEPSQWKERSASHALRGMRQRLSSRRSVNRHHRPLVVRGYGFNLPEEPRPRLFNGKIYCSDCGKSVSGWHQHGCLLEFRRRRDGC